MTKRLNFGIALMLLLALPCLARAESVSDFYLSLEGADGTQARLTAASRFEAGYYPYNISNGNTIIYSEAARYTGETGVEVYDTGLGAAAEFNISVSAPLGTDDQPATFDTSKTYMIQFYAKVSKGSFTIALIKNDSSYMPVLWSPFLTMEKFNGWTRCQIVIGPQGTAGIDHAFTDNYKNARFILRFFRTAAVESHLYLDDLTFTEIPHPSLAEKESYKPNDYLEYTDGTDVYGGFENGKTIKASVAVTNPTSLMKSFQILLAKYSSDGKLQDVSVGENTVIAPKSDRMVYGYMQLSADESLRNNTIRMIILESVQSMNPLAAAVTFPNREIRVVSMEDVGISYLTKPENTGAFYVEPMHEVGRPYEYVAW